MAKIERDLAEVATRGTVGGWSEKAIARALHAIGDTYAVGVAGSAQPAAAAVRSTIGIPDERPFATRWSGVSAAEAAYVDGVACHALDWDDFMLPMYGHCSAVLLPVVWSIASERGMSGKRLVNAFLAGYHVDYLTSVVFGGGHYDRGWHATSTIGTLGGAAAAASLLELDPRQTSNALAIAASYAAGLKVNFGTQTKPLHAGLSARNAVEAALLAAHGVSGSEDWLTGPFGMLDTFGGDITSKEAPDVWERLDVTGNGITTDAGLTQKPYTCCGSCHPALDAVIELAGGVREAGNEIETIEVHVDPIVTDLMRYEVPTSPAEANYSLAWAVAAAAVDLAAGPAQFDESALARTDIRNMRDRVKLVADRPNPEESRFAASAQVGTTAGAREVTVVHGQGHPSNAFDRRQLRAKQHQAMDPVLGEAAASALISLLEALVEIADVGDIRPRAAGRHHG